MKTAIYLRKSRADEEIERKLGEGETLQKHRKILLKFAKENNYDILKIHEEIVSGESIIHRPEMLELLKSVELNLYDAVLVMDIDRLGRGNMQEQGLILETFKKSDTRIITPRKSYNLNDDFDEEYSEFESFMARKELKVINRRLQRGRVQAVEEGNYIGTVPPYGYTKKDSTLIPHPEQADIVRLIFEIYTTQNIGAGTIAKHLNKMSIKSYTGKKWTLNAVTNIINNMVYYGKICWKKKRTEKSKEAGRSRISKTQPKDEWIVADGKHEALITEELYNKAQSIKTGKSVTPANTIRPAVNPLAGLIICIKCGRKMFRRPYANQNTRLICGAVDCETKSSRFDYVEDTVFEKLQELLELYVSESTSKSNTSNAVELYRKSIKTLQTEQEGLKAQKIKLHDLLEQGVYDVTTFLERSQNISDRNDSILESISLIEEKILLESKEEDIKGRIDLLKNIIDIYPTLSDPITKNQLLKSVIEKIEYSKEKSENIFILKIFLKLN